MLILREDEQVRTRLGGRFSLVDSSGLNPATYSSANRAKATTSGVVPDRVPEPISMNGETPQAESAGSQQPANDPKVIGVIIALIFGSYILFK